MSPWPLPATPERCSTRAAPPAARTVPYGEDAAQVYDVRLPARAAARR